MTIEDVLAWCDKEAIYWNPYPEPPPDDPVDFAGWTRRDARAQEAVEIATWIRLHLTEEAACPSLVS